MSFRLERILAWLNPEAYADGKGMQILQSLYGIGSGGVWGKGLGKSMGKGSKKSVSSRMSGVIVNFFKSVKVKTDETEVVI